VGETSPRRDQRRGGTLNTALVTIGITAFNAAGSVERAVNSALAQTWRPIEVLVVDDCSTDGTAEVLASLSSRNPEITIFRNRGNSGVAASRNRILREARGLFVAFFDDDDYSLPERVETQLKRIVAYERDFAGGAPVICHTARRLRFPDGSARIEPTMGQREKRRAPAGISVAKRILLGTPLPDGYGACPTCCQMARLSVYHELGGFDPRLRRGSDTELNIRIAKAGGHFVGIAQPLVVQKMTQTPDKTLEEQYRNMLLLIEKHRDVADNVAQYNFCRRWITAKQLWLERRQTELVLALLSLSLQHPILIGRRLAMALPNIGANLALRRFYGEIEG
jgi:glycosyltransferase involved in cell wall biosynthesis